MFSKELMSFLVKYASEDSEFFKEETVKEIEFKSNFRAKLAHVYVSITTNSYRR
jgi:hypothetical protein